MLHGFGIESRVRQTCLTPVVIEATGGSGGDGESMGGGHRGSDEGGGTEATKVNGVQLHQCGTEVEPMEVRAEVSDARSGGFPHRVSHV